MEFVHSERAPPFCPVLFENDMFPSKNRWLDIAKIAVATLLSNLQLINFKCLIALTVITDGFNCDDITV